MDERNLWLWLAEALHYNPKQIEAVCKVFPSPKDVYDLSLSELRTFTALTKAEQEALADKDLSYLEEKKNAWQAQRVWFLTPADEEYPSALRELPERPAVLFGYGTLPDFSAFSLTLAITGTRSCTRYGERITPLLTRELAEAGVLLVSGLSEGVETLAAREAERVGGTVLAVAAGGIDQIYPKCNRSLFESISKKGAVVSEFPPGTPPLRHLLPYRNRLLSGLSDAVLVVEAGNRSGTRITTDYALSQGRDVLAVPGNIDSAKSIGTNRMIQEGALPVLSAADIFTQYSSRFQGRTIKAPEEATAPELSGAAKLVYDQLDRDEAVTLDGLAEKTGLPMSVLTLVLTQLELAGHIQRLAGNRFVLK